MARITNADLDQLVNVLANQTKKHYYVESTSNKPRLYLADAVGDHEISPRLSRSEFYQWVSGYIDGIGMGYHIAREKGLNEEASTPTR